MSKRLLLTKSKTFPWAETEQFAFRGYFTAKGVLYKDLDAIAFVRENLEHHEFSTVLSKMNGMFSLIYDDDSEVCFATDRVRGLPLFYALIDSEPIISDSAHRLYDVLPACTFDPISHEDFEKNNLFVTGPYTLYEEIRQLQAGEWASFDREMGSLTTDYYFEHADGVVEYKTEQEFLAEFELVFATACQNLKLALNGRTAVVPLSGGIDSREVLLMLRSIGYEKVLCFTYGKKGNIESKIASQVAKHFGYKWLEVPYTKRLWREVSGKSLYKSYVKQAGNFTGLPHTQDFLAVNILDDHGMLPEDSVFLPGHSDAIVGGNLPEVFVQETIIGIGSLLKVTKDVYKPKETLSSQLEDRLKNYFQTRLCVTNDLCAGQHHCFMMKERQAKFIVNSVRVYEYFEYEWLLPLCDLGFLEFFKKVPLSLKYNKKFVRNFMGLEAIPTTGDPSLKRTIFKLVKENAVFRFLGRKLLIPIRYFSSPLQTGGKYGFRPFFRGFLFGRENFDINTIGSQRYLALWNEKK